jgi:hypothetical protein
VLVLVRFASRTPKSEQASCVFGMQMIIPFHAHVAWDGTWLQIKLAGSKARPIDCACGTRLSDWSRQSTEAVLVATQAMMAVVGSQG